MHMWFPAVFSKIISDRDFFHRSGCDVFMHLQVAIQNFFVVFYLYIDGKQVRSCGNSVILTIAHC